MLRVSVNLSAVMSSLEDGDLASILFEGPETEASEEALAVLRTAVAAANDHAVSAAPPEKDDEAISGRDIELTPRGPAFTLMAWEEDGPSESRVRDFLNDVAHTLHDAGWSGRLMLRPAPRPAARQPDNDFRGVSALLTRNNGSNWTPWPISRCEPAPWVALAISWLDGIDAVDDHDQWGGRLEPVDPADWPALLTSWLDDSSGSSPPTSVVRRVSRNGSRTIHFTLEGDVLLHAACTTEQLNDSRDDAIRLSSEAIDVATFACVFSSSRFAPSRTAQALELAGYLKPDQDVPPLSLGRPSAFGWQMACSRPPETIRNSSNWSVRDLPGGRYEVVASRLDNWFQPDLAPSGVPADIMEAATREMGGHAGA